MVYHPLDRPQILPNRFQTLQVVLYERWNPFVFWMTRSMVKCHLNPLMPDCALMLLRLEVKSTLASLSHRHWKLKKHLLINDVTWMHFEHMTVKNIILLGLATDCGLNYCCTGKPRLRCPFLYLVSSFWRNHWKVSCVKEYRIFQVKLKEKEKKNKQKGSILKLINWSLVKYKCYSY